MKLTEEQRKAVECESSVFLTACPGSGKTRVITAKLGRCLEQVESSPRGVACITYTNAAVHEIEARVRRSLSVREAWALDISTIHSFCLNNIFRPYSHRLPHFQQGFKVIGQDSEEFEELVAETRSAFKKALSLVILMISVNSDVAPRILLPVPPSRPAVLVRRKQSIFGS
ncbi:UvrD-helicase domain-containing protein [Achromobacter denitrificans]